MNFTQAKFKHRQLRHRRVTARQHGTLERPRLCVSRSNRYIYAQLIDDDVGRTLASSKAAAPPPGKLTKTDRAALVGKQIAEAALAVGIKQVVFDRGGFRYHGRVKALAEAAREAGLKF